MKAYDLVDGERIVMLGKFIFHDTYLIYDRDYNIELWDVVESTGIRMIERRLI